MTNTIGEHVDIFQTSPNGAYVLNLPAITTLIEWAEGDEALAARFGTWNQGLWAQVLLSEDASPRDTVDTERVAEETRNGVCETAYCMAGQTVVQAGYRLIYTHNGYEEGRPSFSTAECIRQEFAGRRPNGTPIFRDTGDVMAISTAAQRILGMDYSEQSAFFDGDNKVEDLKHMVNAFCQRRGLPEQYPDAHSQRAEDMLESWIDGSIG